VTAAPSPSNAVLSPTSPVTAGGAGRVSLSELLSALSRSLDMTEGQPPGHTLRTCFIGMRLADDLGLAEEERTALYYALLLKDAGCSSNAARMASLFGSDDQAVKYRMKFPDWHRRFGLAVATARSVAANGGIRERLRHFLRIARTKDMTRDLIQVRCDRGADIVRSLGFPGASADTVRSLDEHWCGLGHPQGLQGEAIPLLARIANLAQTLEIFHAVAGPRAALRMARARRGSWFDPALVDRVLGWQRDAAFWKALAAPDIEARVVAAEPGAQARLGDDAELDAVCEAFAHIIDAKSPFTYRHSTNVAAFAVGIAAEAGAPPGELRRLHRAGLLHDVGKLGVSSRILDKPGALTPAERVEIERHPVFSWEILSRVGAFRDFAWTSVLHHERVDGTGYPWRLGGDQLDAAARILAVADIHEALTADRPYRSGMSSPESFAIVSSIGNLCADAVAGLEAMLRRRGELPA
jgi:HD-GYP domain-containing protein (c-di-GMP phosphodiesterase class II)